MDYPLLANIVAHARFVGVGESTHGTHEFFEFKASLFKELVLHHRFNTLLLEDSAYVCRDINKYIKYGVGDLPALMSRLYSVWRIEELQELLEWLHKNSSNYLLEFIGFDIKQTSGNLSVRDELMAANILRLAKKNSSMKALV